MTNLVNPLSITAGYVGLLVLIQLIFTFRVIGVRRNDKISLGDGGNKDLKRRIRGHANFIETVPITIIGIAILELQNQAAWLLHSLFACLVVGRSIHYIGVINPKVWQCRFFGMLITVGVMATSALWLIATNVFE